MTQGTVTHAGTSRPTTLIVELEADEVQGLRALAELDASAKGGKPDLEETAGALLRSALITGLEEARLTWSPSEQDIRKRAAQAAKPDSALIAFVKDVRVRRYGISTLAAALLVALWGGYIYRWSWTGFQSNEQLWDWLHLLLLPVVVGTVPLWLRHGDKISRRSRLAYLLVVAACAVFVAAGYLVPLDWTGFPGNTLWNWFGLLLLPVAVASARFLPSVYRSVRRRHLWGASAVTLAWLLTIVGGYAWRWTWTGYQGNTLWDWLQLLLLPLVVPTILLPAALKWVSGSVLKYSPPGPRAANTAR
jgi:hypothetical protein